MEEGRERQGSGGLHSSSTNSLLDWLAQGLDSPAALLSLVILCLKKHDSDLAVPQYSFMVSSYRSHL